VLTKKKFLTETLYRGNNELTIHRNKWFRVFFSFYGYNIKKMFRYLRIYTFEKKSRLKILTLSHNTIIRGMTYSG